MKTLDTIPIFCLASSALAAPHIHARSQMTPGKIPVQFTGTSFLGTIYIAGQQMSLHVDTGSSDLWVPSGLMPPDQRQKAKDSGSGIFRAKAPGVSDAVIPGATWAVNYGGGTSASGNEVAMLEITTDDGLCVPQQAVDIANNADNKGVGTMGIGHTHDNRVQVNGQSQPQDTMTNQFGWFTLNLGPDGNDDLWVGLGYGDPTMKNGQEMVMQPLLETNSKYQIAVGCTVINGQKIQNEKDRAILDTGTTLTILDPSVVQAFYNAVPGSTQDDNGLYTIPCDSTMPEIPLSVGSQMLTLDPATLIMGKVDGDNMCKGNIQSVRASGAEFDRPFLMYGSAVFRSAYWKFTGLKNDGVGNVGFVPYNTSG